SMVVSSGVIGVRPASTTKDMPAVISAPTMVMIPGSASRRLPSAAVAVGVIGISIDGVCTVIRKPVLTRDIYATHCGECATSASVRSLFPATKWLFRGAVDVHIEFADLLSHGVMVQSEPFRCLDLIPARRGHRRQN